MSTQPEDLNADVEGAGGTPPAAGAPDPASTEEGAPQRTPEKDPSDWATGGEPATGPQLSYLSTLAQEAGVEVPDGLNKADASKLIDELQSKTGRDGSPSGG